MASRESDFFDVCNEKLDHIITEIETLKRDMNDKYKKLNLQFKIIAVSTGACVGILLHRLVLNAMSVL